MRGHYYNSGDETSDRKFANRAKGQEMARMKDMWGGAKIMATEAAPDGDKDQDKPGTLDPVKPNQLKVKNVKNRADDDLDNDGDTDNSDQYLHTRRRAISKAIANRKKKVNNESVDLEEMAVDESFSLEEAAFKVGDWVEADMPKGSTYVKVRGQVSDIDKTPGWTDIRGYFVKDKWSKKMEKHPTSVRTSAPTKNVKKIDRNITTESYDLNEEVDMAKLGNFFDNLKAKQTVYMKIKSVMSSGSTGSQNGAWKEFVVGRRSRSKKYNVDVIKLVVPGKESAARFAQYSLYKRANGHVSLGHGDMAVSIFDFSTTKPSDME